LSATPARVLGVDGCASGWIAVRLDADGVASFAVARDFASLAGAEDALTYIDIPIGLPESGERGCDRAARKVLKGAAARVFLGLRRPLLGFLGDYRAANQWAKSDGKGLSRQAFAILPKIAEIDGAMTPARQGAIRESHPELAFCRLNGGAPLPSKHTEEGLRQRRDIAARQGIGIIDRWLGELRSSGAKQDDLLDAAILAVAARAAAQGPSWRVKCPEARDARGLRMDIWF
jgi:predicted RNase H-like nuclease